MVSCLYHGSSIQNLKYLNPKESGHKKGFVYAVSCKAFAAIFINRKGGSLVASWGRLKNKTPYFCERKKDIFETNYDNQKGSIYVVDKKYFKQNKKLWKEEWVFEQKVPIIEEIKINNLKKYLLNLESKKEIKIIRFKDRKKFFPNIDKELINDTIKLIKKYGYEKTLPNIKENQPKILKKI